MLSSLEGKATLAGLFLQQSYGFSLQSYEASLSVCVCVGPGSDCRDECIQTEDKDSLRELRS